jgi:CheY-like chemotaxis protein/nitrogen-specific signal transduction histidine kinase
MKRPYFPSLESTSETPVEGGGQESDCERAQSVFLDMMTHETRTPLSAMLGAMRLLRATPLTDDQQELVADAQRSGEALLALLDGILELSGAPGSPLDPEEFDIRELCEAMLGVFRDRCRDRGLDMHLQVEELTPARVVGDVTRLRQVLLHLLGNAVKFTEQGHVALVAGLRVWAADAPSGGGCELCLRIEDTGVGIPPWEQQRVFEAFYQSSTSLARTHGGAGLGLTLAARLVRAMGGRLWAESGASGAGSTFCLVVPVSPVSPVVERSSSGVWATGARPTVRRLLVVDDDALQRKILLLQLRRLGLQAEAVSSGPEAIEAVLRGGVDAVLMDIQMPGMDGLEATARIRRALGASAPRIVAVTANTLAGDRERCLSSGLDDFLPKPVSPEGLLRALGLSEPREKRG